MKKSKKFIVLFIWVVLFLYFFDTYMPKGIYYFVVGIPVLFLSAFFILKMFDYSKNVRS
jgi:hypothetical protein